MNSYFLMAAVAAAMIGGPRAANVADYDVRLGTGTHRGTATVTGTADVIINVDSSGETTVRLDPSGNSNLAIDSGKPVFIGTPPDDDGPSTPTTDLTKKTAQMAAAVGDPEAARRLAIAYTVVIETAGNSVSDVAKAARAASQSVYSKADGDWSGFHEFVSAAFIRLEQEGKLSTAAEYTATLVQVRDGLLDSLDGARAERLKLGQILEIVQQVLALIQGDEIDLQKILEIVAVVIKLFALGGMEVSP